MYLERLDIQGFKTFAQKTVLEFLPPRGGKRGIAAIVGPNGSGKCLHGDSRVILADGRRIPIRDLFEDAAKRGTSIEELSDGLCINHNPRNIELLSLNPKTLKIEKRLIGAFIKRKSPAYLLRVRTRMGKEICTTHYHPFFTLKDGQLHTLTAEELKPGIKISTPRLLPIEGTPIYFNTTATLNAFTRKDSVFVPWSFSIEQSVRRAAHATGSLTNLARIINVPLSHIRTLYDRQAIQAGVLAPLAVALPEIRTLKSRGTGHMHVPKKLDEPLARFLGYLISEGRISNGAQQVWFVNEDQKMIEDFCVATKKYFNLEAKRFNYKSTSEDVIIFSTTLGHYLEKIFGIKINGRSAEKIVPPQMFQAPLSVVSAFLGALFEGDGYVSFREYRGRQSSYIEYATASRELAHGITTLLLRLGITSICHAKQKCATNTVAKIKRTYYSIYIYGNKNLKKFAHHVSFVGKKQKKLDMVMNLADEGNPNIDIIPTATHLVREAVITSKTMVKPLRKASPKLAAYNEQRCDASRDGLLETISMIRTHRQNEGGDEILAHLETLARSDVLWDEVVSVEKIQPEEWVYDLTIPETHNFIAENFIVHNSNSADAVRWVLGEQSMKLLRGKKSEDVIFSGTEKRGRAGFAEVTITLNNEDHQAPIDYTTLAITRRLYRDGNSEYLLNNQLVRLGDIQLLLAQANFGQRTYSVIGQGMVDHVLVASPSERKEFFDEAAGVKQFQIKRDQAENKLEHTKENLAQAGSLLAEIEPRLRSLSRQVRRLEERGPLEEEMKTLGRAYYGKLWNELLAAIVDAQEKASAVEKKRMDKIQELDALRRELTSIEKQETQTAGFLDLQKEYEAAIEERNRAREELLKTGNAIALAAMQTSKGTALPTARILTALEELTRSQKELLDQLDDVHSLDDLKSIREKLRAIVLASETLLRDITKPAHNGAPDEKLIKQKGELSAALVVLNKKLEEIQKRVRNYSTEERGKKEHIFETQRTYQTKQADLFSIDQKMNEIKIELARLETRRDGLAHEVHMEMGKPPLEALAGNVPALTMTPEESLERFRKLKIQLDVIGSIDPEIIKEHGETKERHDFLKTHIDDLTKATADLEAGIAELDRIIEERAEVAFKTLNAEFGKYFKILFGGGHAGLTKTEPADDDEEGEALTASQEPKSYNLNPKSHKKDYTGIEISANPPGKRVKSINMLSGGERALTSIAIICAIMTQNPSPFVVLDEVDAALDESNSIRFADIIDELAHKTQFIVITHNRATMEKANVLYGVTMNDDGVSRVLSLKLEDVEKIRNGEKIAV